MLQPDLSGDAPSRERSARFTLPSPVVALAIFLVGVLVGGVAAVAGRGPSSPRPVAAAAAVHPSPRASSVAHEASAAPRHAPTRRESRPSAHVTRSAPAPKQRVVHAPPRSDAAHAHRRTTRWLPSGTGMWTYLWNHTAQGNAHAVVRRAQHRGISTLYVRTGTTDDGFIGAPVLRRLLPATRGTSVKVVAWDFPMLVHPRREAHRLAAAVRYDPPGRHTPRVAAVAPDIETPSEGTRTTRRHVAAYLHALRRDLPRRVAILSTVPWPSEVRRGRYPYGIVARHSDALIPMAYWYNRSPSGVTAFSIRWLRHHHKPVLPVGQGYDSRIDAPYLPHSHQWREVRAFLRTARRLHVRAVSLWSWQTAGPAQWHALRHFRRAFLGPRHLAEHKAHRRTHHRHG